MIDDSTFQGLRSALPGDRFNQIIHLFRTTGIDHLADMESAMKDGRMDDVDRAAHTLKSSAAIMGAMELSKLCKHIEATTRAGETPEVADVRRVRVEFEAALQHIDIALA